MKLDEEFILIVFSAKAPVLAVTDEKSSGNACCQTGNEREDECSAADFALIMFHFNTSRSFLSVQLVTTYQKKYPEVKKDVGLFSKTFRILPGFPERSSSFSRAFNRFLLTSFGNGYFPVVEQSAIERVDGIPGLLY